MSKSKAVISASNLSKSFGTIRAVNNISFKIFKGEIVGILGPNGAGKTTTIRIITGLLESESEAQIKVFNINLKKNPIKTKTSFGIVPEISNAYMDFTVWKNLEFTGKIYGLSTKIIETRAKRLLKQFDLLDKINAKTKNLSKGLKQRLNFCSALLHDPPILILDEPTSGLDPISVSIMRKRILHMKEQGKTILITTHDMQEAQNICDRVLIMNMGKIIRDADPDTLRKNFKQKSVISFKIEEELSSELIEKLENLFNYKTIKKNFYEFWSDVPLEDISILNRFIKAHKIKVINLQIKQASLEEVFIELIKKTKNGDDNV